MKKIISSLIAIVLSVQLQAQTKPVILPGKGKLDIEGFYKHIDTKTDLSKLSLAELRVLRNGFAARQGYIFKEADLRNIFSQTSWYDSLTWERFDGDNADADFDESKDNYGQKPPKLTSDEELFVKRIIKQEEKLRERAKTLKKGMTVNLDLLLNPFQLETFPKELHNAISRNGFAIVPNDKQQLFHIYEKNDYANFPSFVTTDLYLQLFHFYFDNVLRDIEERKLDSLVTLFNRAMYNRMTELATSRTVGSKVRQAAEQSQAYFAVALALQTGRMPAGIRAVYRDAVANEVRNVNESADEISDFLGYPGPAKFPYSLFRPRGHYTRSERIQRYFKTMMWLQTVPFGTDKPKQLQQALLMASVIGGNEKMKSIYEGLFQPMTFLFGTPDNITIMQVYELMQKRGMSIERLFSNEVEAEALRSEIEQTAERQTRIRPKYESTSRYKINIMPQRYMPDAEVLNEMVDYTSIPTRRNVPRGLDVFAAMGSRSAELVLTKELNEPQRWQGFTHMLDSMKRRMTEINWTETVATTWMNALSSIVGETPNNAPYFMRTPQWDKKNLNSALASWAELKHDAILYAKQPMGAECGSGGPPEPIVKGYVEPNVAFWQKAIDINTKLWNVLERYNLVTDKAQRTSERVKDLAAFLLRVSQKQLNGERLTDDEYQSIEIIGSTCEYISLDLVRDNDDYLDGWHNVEGADKSIAVVADVYTANARNNFNHSILYEATGPAYEIYVAVPINGELYLMRGAVFSYREFERSTDEQRLTDEEWQEKLKTKPFIGTPQWMNEITVPLEQTPTDNEEIFYSSGC